MGIEGLRTDSLYLGNIRISQLVAFICFIAGSLLLILLRARAKKGKPAEGQSAESVEAAQVSGADKFNKNSMVENDVHASRTLEENAKADENTDEQNKKTNGEG